MLKKLGFQSRDTPPLSSRDNIDGATSSPSNSKLLEIEKKKARHNKKVVRKTTSFDSIESESFAPRPHMPSTIYSPDPFPLDPSQPDGLNRNNVFHHHRREVHEVESIDIEIEETKGFVSGKSRTSIDGEDRDDYIGDGNTNKISKTQKLGAGIKGAIAKSGLGKSKDKEKEKENIQIDAVLQYNIQQQQQQQKKQKQNTRYSDSEQNPARGRERERHRTQSGHHYPEKFTGGDVSSPDRVRSDREERSNRQSRLHSLSPPPSHGQQRRNSGTYWPDDHRSGIYSEQVTPFIGYQPPPVSPSRRQHEHYQQQNRQPRPLSMTSDVEYGENSRVVRNGRYRSRERRESDRMRRDAGISPSGRKRQSGLNQVTNADSGGRRTSSELGDDERNSIELESRRKMAPDRLNRAKEWVASHSKNNSIAAPAPVADRETSSSFHPGLSRSNNNNRYSMEPEEYGLISPPRGSHMSHAGGEYDSRERMVMSTQMYMQNQERDYRERMADDGRYWSHQLEGYERDRYRQNKVDYEYTQEGFHGYAPGGPDDVDEDVDSTIAAGSAVGVGPTKKGTENSGETNKAKTADEDDQEDLEDPLASPKVPNKKRMILRLISLLSSFLVLVLLIGASPVNIFVCISKYPCAVGGQNGWCDMYNSSVFLGMVAFVSFLVALGWDIWGSFDHSKIYNGGPLMKPPPPGFDKVAMSNQGQKKGGKKLASGGMGQGGGMPGGWPGQGNQGQGQGQEQGQGMKPKKNKKYQDAIEKYTEAIELNPNVAAYYANRAFAHTKIEAYGAAI
ncbi:hypothetical protein BGZ76_003662, partial [Entomortierella beljakovae]